MASGDRGCWRGWSQTRKGFERPSLASGPGPARQWRTREVQAEPSLWLLRAEEYGGERGRREADGTIPMEDGETWPRTGRGRGRADGEVRPQGRPVQGAPALGGGTHSRGRARRQERRLLTSSEDC